jgi:hypothetical protein
MKTTTNNQDLSALFNEKIKNITDSEQQKYLYDVLYGVFKSFADYSDSRYIELEKRIENEIRSDLCDEYCIYTAVTSKGDLNNLSDFWFEAGGFDYSGGDGNIAEVAGEKASASIEIYVNCGYELIKPYINQVITADIRTDKKDYHEVSLRIDFAKVYREKIKRLYELFSLNGRPWRTVYCPFMFKFMDLTDENGIVPADEIITGYRLKNFGPGKYILNDMTLLWNIQGFEVPAEVKYFPAENIILYDHKVKIKHLESKYLFYGNGLTNFYSQRHSDKPGIISVISETPEQENILVCRIAEAAGNAGNINALSNGIKPYRTGGAGRTIVTQGEIERICGSYKDIDGLKLAEIRIEGETGKGGTDNDGDFYNLNDFIEAAAIDSFDNRKKRLVLSFEVRDKNNGDIFLYEKMWFLVSEVQLYFNEYKCVGEIV